MVEQKKNIRKVGFWVEHPTMLYKKFSQDLFLYLLCYNLSLSDVSILIWSLKSLLNIWLESFSLCQFPLLLISEWSSAIGALQKLPHLIFWAILSGFFFLTTPQRHPMYLKFVYIGYLCPLPHTSHIYHSRIDKLLHLFLHFLVNRLKRLVLNLDPCNMPLLG